MYTDGARMVRFTDWMWAPNPSRIDMWKQKIENWVGASVDWWPLRHVLYSCPRDYTKISWEASFTRIHLNPYISLLTKPVDSGVERSCLSIFLVYWLTNTV